MKALLNIAILVKSGGKNVTAESIEKAKTAGATDIEIHDTVIIAALFCLYNRNVDGLATTTPNSSDFYGTLAARIAGCQFKNSLSGSGLISTYILLRAP